MCGFYGTLRSLMTYREEGSNMRMNVFRSSEEAMNWLKSEQELLKDVNQG